MKRFICFVFFLFSLNAFSQQNHFVYIQTENKQAFYVRLSDKVFSAASSGYVIIPRLKDGSYTLTIGFPQNEWAAQNITISINNDEGFLLKNFADKGWGLFNTHTMDVLMATASAEITTSVAGGKEDGFSNVLASVTNTPLDQQHIVESPAMLVDTNKTNRNIAADKGSAAILSFKATEQVFSLLDSTGRSVIYVTYNGNDKDTVRLFIPYENNRSVSVTNMPVNNKPTAIIDTVNIAQPVNRNDAGIVAKQTDGEIIKVADDAVITDIKVTDVDKAGSNKSTITMLNPNCRAMATDDDFLKLRKKMAAADNDDEMISTAKKSFRSKCFSTDQIKNLSMLFLKDDGKYNFYDASYGHVNDSENFKTLQSQLTDEYYITRFKAILR